MLSQEENDLLTRVGPGTPGGKLLRSYWQPAALSEELPVGGAPLPVRLLGEELVLFRDEQGQPGLLGIHCAHRGADLSYGRLEDGGLRCIYHGWLYDVNGRCLEQPGEPTGSTFHERIRHTAYPCVEADDLILTYMGGGEPPLVPNYDFLTAPGHRLATKLYQECNYLQANEGNIDPVHHSFLHMRFGEGDDSRFSWYSSSKSPQIEIEEEEFGLRVYAVRRIDEERNYIKVTNFILPNLSAITGDADGYGVNWHVPIDDTHHWNYNVTYRRTQPLTVAPNGRTRESAVQAERARSKANRYLQNRAEMKDVTFSGLGKDFQAEDACVTEGAGPIQDRTAEHIASTDKAIVAARVIMLRAIRAVQAGLDPQNVVRDPARNAFPDLGAKKDIVPTALGWRRYWEAEGRERDMVSALTPAQLSLR
ncbi:MAG: phthalate 4,5-dioxygenase [Chloroflexi bacterium]|nr:phthalate 4,5-dioxygenase [Chloroflexota bacterium]